MRRACNDLEGALTAYEEGLEIKRRLMATDPSHSERARDVFVSLAKNRRAELGRGKKDSACARFAEAIAIIKPLAKRSPDIYQLQLDLAWIESQIAETGCP